MEEAVAFSHEVGELLLHLGDGVGRGGGGERRTQADGHLDVVVLDVRAEGESLGIDGTEGGDGVGGIEAAPRAHHLGRQCA